MEYLPFNQILEEKNKKNENVYYIDELISLEWRNKRELILKRDNYECTNCTKKQTINDGYKYLIPYSDSEQEEFEKKLNIEFKKQIELILGVKSNKYIKSEKQFHQVFEPNIIHVHHKYYVNGKLAWEYSNDALISLCQECHQYLHDHTDIPVYEIEDQTNEVKLTKCQNCNGSGYLPKFHYFKDGICFSCNGYKYIELIKK